MKKIKLCGVLGKTFGKYHERLIDTPKEAVQALCCTVDGFEKFLIHSKEKGLTFAVFRGKRNIGLDELGYPVGEELIRIVPVIIGSKKAGFLQTILGTVIVAVGAIATFGFGQAWGVNVMMGGGAMMLGGVVQMLSPQPAGLARKESADNKASYAFGGVTNTASQGYPVSLLYGKRRIGGAIISAGIYVEDQQ
ncbi:MULTISPECIES: tail assembly protein [Klebsiella pneumoniae complex]|mgnify:CR=1 FL=1|uniref:tail assembly protein n=1 Tax=Klebsiella pneumoniae complex TaxID=3390273 RepID=UPI000E2A7512|nr:MULTISPECIES: tail assembly protein [Klebsiella]HDH1397413.1 tail assembly protein [Klebsiella quasipneumoniae subsp. similipneumoniae]EIV2285190.1 tail assembly protein [Klebsiella pneumoniae]EIW8723427.1 tail assembly protein [Klebsiella pneumoniae]EIX9292145.1 tail assembly protein [Klebsiella pneumoniae]ELA2415081.1 tail assembly protein [Klebsiella pneumoniae]